MAERYNPNKRKRREPTFSGLDALNQPAQQDTSFFGLEGREQLQGAKRRPTTALPKQKRGFDMPGAQIKPTIPTDTATPPLKNLPPIQHTVNDQQIRRMYDNRFGPKFSSDPGKGRPVPTPPLAKRPWRDSPTKPTNGIVGGATPYAPKSRADGKLRRTILKEHANISNEAEQEALDEFGYPLTPTARRPRSQADAVRNAVRGAMYGPLGR
jgi:hypothetical protein